MTGDPLVVRLMRQFRAGLITAEAAQMAEMAARWAQIERAIEADLISLAAEVDRLNRTGKPVSRWKIYRLSRYRRLIDQINGELTKYTRYATDLVSGRQADLLEQGISNAEDAINAVMAESANYFTGFDILPVSAIENMVGLAGDGSPLRALFNASWPEATEALLSTLIEATAKGQHPLQTARLMREAFGVGFQRSMTIARTEQLRVYREASRQQYQESGIVRGYRRLSAKDFRVCAACLFADGKFYPVDVPFEEHPRGRCTPVPTVMGSDIQWLTGKEWFKQQPESVQIGILGKGRHAGWKNGLFGLDQVIKRRENETWGASLVPRPLKELVANA